MQRLFFFCSKIQGHILCRWVNNSRFPFFGLEIDNEICYQFLDTSVSSVLLGSGQAWVLTSGADIAAQCKGRLAQPGEQPV